MTSMKIVKSDPRGRISGLEKGVDYEVTEHDDGSYTVRPAEPAPAPRLMPHWLDCDFTAPSSTHYTSLKTGGARVTVVVHEDDAHADHVSALLGLEVELPEPMPEW